MTISLILLFISYIINVTLLLNKDLILKRLSFLKKNFLLTKVLTYYLNYQLFLIKLSLIFTPILIFIGLLLLCKGFHFLITHQLPLEIIGINMETVINTNSK